MVSYVSHLVLKPSENVVYVSVSVTVIFLPFSFFLRPFLSCLLFPQTFLRQTQEEHLHFARESWWEQASQVHEIRHHMMTLKL